jgi:hypothetical protein
MPVCLYLKKPVTSSSGPPNELLVKNNTAVVVTDLTQCELVGFTGQEYGASVMLANASAGKAVDFPLAGEYFAWSFVSTIVLWSVAYGAGQLIELIRKS